MNPNPVLGVMTLCDPREEVFDRAPEIWQPTISRHNKIIKSLKKVGDLTVISTDEIVRSKDSAIKVTICHLHCKKGRKSRSSMHNLR
jgi:hypothetical protein